MIQLEPFTAEDFSLLQSWISDETILTNWAGSLFSFPLTTESLQWYISDTNVAGSSDAFVYKAVEITTGEVVGHISLGGISWKNKSARISRVFISPLHCNKGYCKQMVKAVLQVGFNQLLLHRIGLGVYTHNKAAINCYTAIGMHIEGVQKDILFYNNEYWSMVEMAMLENDWQLEN